MWFRKVFYKAVKNFHNDKKYKEVYELTYSKFGNDFDWLRGIENLNNTTFKVTEGDIKVLKDKNIEEADKLLELLEEPEMTRKKIIRTLKMLGFSEEDIPIILRNIHFYNINKFPYAPSSNELIGEYSYAFDVYHRIAESTKLYIRDSLLREIKNSNKKTKEKLSLLNKAEKNLLDLKEKTKIIKDENTIEHLAVYNESPSRFVGLNIDDYEKDINDLLIKIKEFKENLCEE